MNILPHPGEAIPRLVFDACCLSLAAWRVPFPRSGLVASSSADCAFMNELKRLRSEGEPIFHEGQPQPQDERVEWEDFVGSMHAETWNERGFAGLLASHRMAFLIESQQADPDFIGLAVRTASEVPWVVGFAQAIRPPWEPFHPLRVFGWLESLGLIEDLPDGNFRSAPRCFRARPVLRQTGLGRDVLAELIEWLLGADGPSAAFLDCHLVDETGDAMGAAEILAVKAISAPPERMLALLLTIPTWSVTRRTQFHELIAARWIRGLEQFGRRSALSIEVGAAMLHRWEQLAPCLSEVPCLRFRPRGESNGFGRHAS